MKRSRVLGVFLATVVFTVVNQHAAPSQQSVDQATKVDDVFKKWTASTPGCAVAVSVGGKGVLEKAYGMADLEHDVRNMPDSVFEAGSVSKQFTVAAVLQLVADGKIALDDPVRKYIPELPDYATPLTIRHMLTHTSGLRDWGSVESIAGWPRTSRVYTHAHVLDIVSRQSKLNFTPGTQWSYSNTGFNLAAIIVTRVSGMPFAEFSKKRIFEPLGMTHTQWRDDFTRIVKNRTIAYDEAAGVFSQDMPFENIHGNGGLLTTVGDLLKWNENFETMKVGDPALIRLQQQPGKFSDGRSLDYGLGLFIDTYKGLHQIHHSGSTAGYRAELMRIPERGLSVAVLCNVGSGNATGAARAVADLYLTNVKTPDAPKATYTLTTADSDAVVGTYKSRKSGLAQTITRSNEGLIRLGNATLVPQSATRFVTAAGDTWEFTKASARQTNNLGTSEDFERVAPAKPTAAQLRDYLGAFTSNDAETVLTAAIEKDQLVLKRRPDTIITLTPLYADAFRGSIGTVIFRRDASGKVNELSVVQDRVWDLRFKK